MAQKAQRKKPQVCPVCRKPFSGRVAIRSAEFSLEFKGMRTVSRIDDETFIHDDGRRCRREV
jgi:hypothetical protein